MKTKNGKIIIIGEVIMLVSFILALIVSSEPITTKLTAFGLLIFFWSVILYLTVNPDKWIPEPESYGKDNK